jgi:YidC/Oxa1 family membrane protein insertase
MDTKRLILFVIFSFSILMLWEAWQRDRLPEAPAVVATQSQDASVPQGVIGEATSQNDLPSDSVFRLESAQRVHIQTDLFRAEIDTLGGDLRHLELLKHKASDSSDEDFTLMSDSGKPMIYVAQSGLIGDNLPNHKKVFTSPAATYKLSEDQDWLEVR